MTERFFVGPNSNGKTVMRITPPGFSALNEKSPFVMSSEHDYLKIHARGSLELQSDQGDNYTEWFGEYAFPQLDHIPLSFVFYQVDESNSGFYTYYPAIPDSETGLYYPAQNDVIISNNRIWFYCGTGQRIGFVNIYVHFIIFKNKMMEF